MTRILVIEDDRMILENVLEILSLEGFEVRGAANGKIGLDLAMQFQPDLIICDIAMPEMNGYEVLMALRDKPEMAAVPLIFLTAKASKVDVRYGMELGADDYLTKPFSAQDLLLAVNTRLRKYHAIAQKYGQQLENLRKSINHALPHELRTPLYGIMGNAMILLEDFYNMESDDVLSVVEGIYHSAERLNRLIENYLLYAQLELMTHDSERRAALRESATLQPTMITRETAVLAARSAEREADLNLSLIDVPVRVAEESLGKIVGELVENAFKFSTPGTPVSVTPDTAGDQFMLKAADQGRGKTAPKEDNIVALRELSPASKNRLGP